MADTWKCRNCETTIRCSCNSMECSFDYDIKHHVRQDLYKALELALDWYPAHDVVTLTEKYITVNKEPCCDACAKNNG
jgi:hypothetical protein